MSSANLELVRICESLPEAKQAEVTGFARFLLERESDEKWESIVAEGEPRPKFEAFLRDSAAEEAMPLEPEFPMRARKVWGERPSGKALSELVSESQGRAQFQSRFGASGLDALPRPRVWSKLPAWN